ncbi:MAG: trypsin-like serine protease [Myxococcales bacterium]|nr:trypsin-like serine protease [Myxococcales bacterium]
MAGRRLEAVGYGVTAFEGGGGGVKRHVDIPIVGYGAAWPDGDGMVVLNDPVEGRDSCQGDSGGPNVYIRGDGYVQVAITSYGDGCGSGGGGWNVRTDLYIDWIEDTAGIQVQTDFVRPPRFVCSHQLNPGSPTSIAFGRLPMALQCAIDSGDPETIEEVTWFWGDGSSAEVSTALTASHTYTEMGVYSLRACISGVRGENPYTECQLVPNHVTACGVPQVSFSATPREGLRIEVENQTSLRAPACVTNVQWDVFSGPAIAGTPLFSHSTWQPDLDLSEHGPGVYTIVLNAGGIGGTGAARATVEVGRGRGCSTTPGGSLPSLALLVLPLVVRRRCR